MVGLGITEVVIIGIVGLVILVTVVAVVAAVLMASSSRGRERQ